jgi:hypothetical protein
VQYKLVEGGLQYRFQESKSKIQIFGGGFGNGKTTSGVIKALKLARDYPGSNGLIARSTYPKLNDTVRKEFLKWCPDSWIKRKNLSQDNVVELENGSIINFRYIAQQGKSNESSTSNLLSATYDWILVDQVEDPEIQYKDYLDLLGRLRGNARYAGDDPTMPTTGPRWMMLLCNPTRNWVYKKLVKPLHDFHNGIINPDLTQDGDGKPIIELFEGSTYENRDNLPSDFIETLEAEYKGQMRKRFLLGEWGGFEGLVYPQYDQVVHMLDYETIINYYERQIFDGFDPTIIEAYDHGIAKPACYLLAFVDGFGNVFVFDGFHQAEASVDTLAQMIKQKRRNLHNMFGKSLDDSHVLADPAVFRRTSGDKRTVGVSVAGMYAECGIRMVRANNDIVSGIAKVQGYLAVDSSHRHPIKLEYGSPRIFFCNNLQFIDAEIVDYYWKKDQQGEYDDLPMDRNDHAMDTLKYLLSHRPRVAMFARRDLGPPPSTKRWTEQEIASNTRTKAHRYA